MTTCNHTYTTLGHRRFRCVRPPHDHHPDQHYFVRDEPQPEPPRRSLIVTPGQRR